jgi:uncharacterized protein (UPF0212 family)
MALITLTLTTALAATVVASPPGEAPAVQREVKAIRAGLQTARIALNGDAHCKGRIGAEVESTLSELMQTVTARVLERIRTDLKWMSRISSDECPPVGRHVDAARVAAERALLVLDLETERLSEKDKAEALRAELERAKAAQAEAARAESGRKAAEAEAAKAREAELVADCWRADDPGCGVLRDGQRAVGKAEFERFLESARKTASELRRIDLVKSVGTKSWYTTAQVAALMDGFASDIRREEVVKLLAARVVDPKNGFTLKDHVRSSIIGKRVVELMMAQVK